MATIRDLLIFTLEKTFNKIKSDFSSYEDEISTDKKSDFKEKPGYEGFYGFWNHFYLDERKKGTLPFCLFLKN